MTVRELVRELLKYDPELRVKMCSRSALDHTDVTSSDWVYIPDENEGYVLLDDFEEGGDAHTR